jgi:glyoxylase-like metal-dependent hydrolase (beta-lactamase superfamily II)
MIGSLKVIHTPGHTPGHMSLYYEEDRILFGADTIYKHVFGAEGMYISPAQVSIDRPTAIVSAQRLSKVKFDKLLMSHQDFPCPNTKYTDLLRNQGNLFIHSS